MMERKGESETQTICISQGADFATGAERISFSCILVNK